MYLVKDIQILSKEHNSFPVVMVQKCKNCRCKVSIGIGSVRKSVLTVVMQKRSEMERLEYTNHAEHLDMTYLTRPRKIHTLKKKNILKRVQH